MWYNMFMVTLDTTIDKLYSVGKATAARLERMGINTVRDLMFFFPFRYEDYRKITAIKDLQPNTSANIVGQIELISNKRSHRKRFYITEAIVSDTTDQAKVIWFNQPFIAKNLNVGDRVSLAGKVEEDNFNTIVLKSPVYEKIISGQTTHTSGLVPIYHLTSNLTQKQIRFLVKQILPMAGQLEDWLPPEIVKRQKLFSLPRAIEKIHFPSSFSDIDNARKRLGFEELFLVQIQTILARQKLESSPSPKIKFRENEIKAFVKNLSFTLTLAQKKAAWEIITNMQNDRPMSRLLEGDVGSGKTVVAVMAMLNTALNGYQAALMVPTEILAYQHYENILKLLKSFGLTIGLVTRSKIAISNNPNNEKMNSSFVIRHSPIVIGTHALIQEKIEFTNLALAIIDEQHRFGVEQRLALMAKSNLLSDNKKAANKELPIPHLLTMTATPIPRSLALALYGDLKLSIIDEMPAGRKPISTHIVPEHKRVDGYRFIRKEIGHGRQVFVICPLIDISDKTGVKSVKEEYKKLDETIFPDLPIGFLHGRLKPKEKERVMQDFLDNKISILVSTSVVEVGVDVPNATIMMIEGADRFGLAQLHQFRGRVGRGAHQSYCFLFTDSDSPVTIQRLEALSQHHSGFELAKIDLELRGPGEVYGTAQKGFPELKVATLFDYELMKTARDEAEKLLKKDKDLEKHPLVQNQLKSKKILLQD